ncbi:MAG: sulfotransferase [Phaeodactylibacter xiamenensis]|uniref:Sulfotransferase family protein n=1 Tax=Phaeodactylibacter xiamenensis TaxID=1524460 RepID=A0A098SEN7_9BACT|nr:sulfotransferase [Phaeodactylibacter xiamenensis]KGE89412.1 hypothetical protein IX84_03630 [Phaeodactylibacter xiamenensis]MCR9051445.1 sulfotransferase [bacterium]
MSAIVQRINAWSSPRNISTALMYAFRQRADTTVVDEPLYAHFLKHGQTEVVHPGASEILSSQLNEGEEVVKQVLLGHYTTPVAFFKQMTHHLVAMDESFLQHMDNIMLIRDPRAIIASYAKVIPNPGIDDIGVEQQYHLFQKLQAMGALRAVVDARQLLLDPEGVLRQLCDRLGLAFDKGMLKWAPGPRPEDGVWASYWYSRVHTSTGFQAYEERTYEVPPKLEALAKHCAPYYHTLFDLALKAREV